MGTGRSIPRAFSRCCILLGGFIVASSTAAIADKDYPTSIINGYDNWGREILPTTIARESCTNEIHKGGHRVSSSHP
jgi:hypothetical protein